MLLLFTPSCFVTLSPRTIYKCLTWDFLIMVIGSNFEPVRHSYSNTSYFSSAKTKDGNWISYRVIKLRPKYATSFCVMLSRDERSPVNVCASENVYFGLAIRMWIRRQLRWNGFMHTLYRVQCQASTQSTRCGFLSIIYPFLIQTELISSSQCLVLKGVRISVLLPRFVQ